MDSKRWWKNYKVRERRDIRKRKCGACSNKRHDTMLERMIAHGYSCCPWAKGIMAHGDTPEEVLACGAEDPYKHHFLLLNPRLPELAQRHDFRQEVAWGIHAYIHFLLTSDELDMGYESYVSSVFAESELANVVADLLGRPNDGFPTGFAFFHRLLPGPDPIEAFREHTNRLELMRPVLERIATFGYRPTLGDVLGI